MLAILERMIGSSWNLLQKRCTFMPIVFMEICRGLKIWGWVALVLSAWVFVTLQDRIIASRKSWTSRSWNLISPNLFLLGYLKEIIYRNKPHTIEALCDIWLEIAKTGRDVLRQKTGDLKRRFQMCQVEGGRHFQHLMYVKSSSSVAFVSVTFVSLHSVRTLRNCRPQTPRLLICYRLITLHRIYVYKI